MSSASNYCAFTSPTVSSQFIRTSRGQGLKFRRNFGEIRRKISFSLVTGKKNSVFFGKFRLKIQNSKSFGQNTPKFAEIYRNFGTEFRFR